MTLFTSKKERKLWILNIVVISIILSTLGVDQQIANFMRAHSILNDSINFVAVLSGLGVIAYMIKMKSGFFEYLTFASACFVLFWMWLRIDIPEERTHLIEYLVVSALFYRTFKERALNMSGFNFFPLKAFATAILVGVMDEVVQYFLPNRVFDIIDVGFNVIAVTMGTLFCLIIDKRDKLKQFFMRR